MRRERVGGGREPVGALVDRIESHIVWILVVLREWKKRHPNPVMREFERFTNHRIGEYMIQVDTLMRRVENLESVVARSREAKKKNR
ncbi:MAG: hypothetical protein EHM49_01265 [Deltaproteobacteria bacterium]|nr:MAG: hypothetical protein EHM49_01265 [Deltaproteobacteria bacterium]